MTHNTYLHEQDGKKMLREYYQLTKPGIIYGNVINATAGFLLASPHYVDWWLLVAVLLGSSLVIASGCVFNNYIDRKVDAKMTRTKHRALVEGRISTVSALIYATALGLIGFTLLAVYTNWLVVLIGLVGFVDYVVVYGIAKRYTEHSTLIGSISGATPILAGYCAASGHLDIGAWLAFLILIIWQMPHFYGIAMYRRDDYKKAGLPILSVARGMRATKIQTLVYIAAFTVATSLLTVFHYTGYIYLTIMLIVGLSWLVRGLRLYNIGNDAKWGRKMFLYSLLVIMVTSVMLSVGARLP